MAKQVRQNFLCFLQFWKIRMYKGKMTFRDILSSEKSIDSLRSRVLFDLSKDLERRPHKPGKDQIEAALSMSIEHAIETVTTKVSHWSLTADTFHDAFMMT